MFDIKLDYNDMKVRSVEREDIEDIYSWINVQSDFYNLKNNMDNDEYKEFYDRFLEYYFSECEFFLKIKKENKLIGLLKGRTEFKNPNEVWIRYLLLDKSIRNKKVGSKILSAILKYFFCDCGISNFYTRVQREDYKYINFFEKNKFYVKETLKNSSEEVTILKKHMIKT